MTTEHGSFSIILCGGCDSLRHHLLLAVGGQGPVQRSAKVLQPSHDARVHLDPPPPSAGPVQHGPHERKTAVLSREPPDHLDPSAGLPEGPLDEVGVPDPPPVLAGEP